MHRAGERLIVVYPSLSLQHFWMHQTSILSLKLWHMDTDGIRQRCRKQPFTDQSSKAQYIVESFQRLRLFRKMTTEVQGLPLQVPVLLSMRCRCGKKMTLSLKPVFCSALSGMRANEFRLVLEFPRDSSRFQLVQNAMPYNALQVNQLTGKARISDVIRSRFNAWKPDKS